MRRTQLVIVNQIRKLYLPSVKICNLMWKIFIFVFILSSLVRNSIELTTIDPKAVQQKIKWLNDRLMKRYWKKNQQYVFPIFWEHQKGLFESRVHFNILDKRNTDLTAFIRDDFFKIDDINMFVTSFILYGLVEAKQLKTIEVNDHLLSESLMAISNFRDKNTPDGIPQYTFWPQQKVNGTWTAQANNLVHSVNLVPTPPPFMQKILDRLGLAVIGQAKNIAKAFSIPADNDDSSVNLALLGLLKQTKSSHYEFWNSLHLKKQAYYDRALKYAYRPFGPVPSNNKHADEIDPRTYFVMKQFLDKKNKESENPSLILPTTWLLNTDQQIDGLISMPFRSNNVDASVCANFLFGLSYQVISGEVQLSDELKKMMLDTTELLQFTVTNILKKRPTLMLVYYPSKYDFYWFIARIVGLLKRNNGPNPLGEIRTRLQTLMKEVSTQQIIKSAVKTSNGSNWQEFLGNYANKERKQDAIFSTSLALNALLDTWTVRKGSNVVYDSDITNEIKSTIEEGVKYLLSALHPKMKQLNAFFSGSLKIFDNTFPYFFPANLAVDGKGKPIDPTNMTMKNLTWSTNVYMKGYVEAEKYNEMLKKKWFGHEVPEKQVSLNTGKGLTFPFWSSRAISEVMAITSLSKYLKATSNKIEDTIKNIRIENLDIVQQQ